MAAIIQTNALTKYYGRSRGILDVTFSVQPGEVFGFLGPNGAGKTTTIRVLMGFLRPSAGSATISNLDCWAQAPAVKRLVGYLPSDFAPDPGLTGAQILEYLGHLRGGVDQQYLRQLMERLELDPGKRFRDYSHGNKQKIGLIQAFMHRPRLLLLDEPTAGLDPLNQQEFHHLVAEARANGQTIFLSSHVLPEVEQTCDRVGIIREGRLVKVDTVATLKDIQHHVIDLHFAEPASPAWFQHLPGVRDVSLVDEGYGIHLTVQADMSALIEAAAAHHATHIATHEPSLEEIFLRFYAPGPALSSVTQ